MKTTAREHTEGINLLQRGHKPRPPFTRPTLGSVLAQQLGQLESALPDFILLDPCPEGNEFKGFKAGNWAGWLGAAYAPVRTGGEFKIPHVGRLDSITEDDHEAREELLSNLKFERVTSRTIDSESRFRDEIESVQKQGYAISNEEQYMGIRALSVPIRDAAGTVRAAVSLNGGITERAWRNEKALVELAKIATTDISRRSRFV